MKSIKEFLEGLFWTMALLYCAAALGVCLVFLVYMGYRNTWWTAAVIIYFLSHCGLAYIAGSYLGEVSARRRRRLIDG